MGINAGDSEKRDPVCMYSTAGHAGRILFYDRLLNFYRSAVRKRLKENDRLSIINKTVLNFTGYFDVANIIPIFRDVKQEVGYMALRQEAYAMIDTLPDDDSVRFFIDMIKRFNVVMKKTDQLPETQNRLSEKRQAFLHMEEMKKQYTFPKDYDYEQVRREAMKEKYGCIN